MNDQKRVSDITMKHPMHYLEKHPFFLIKWVNNARINSLIKQIGNVDRKVIADIGCESGILLSKIYNKYSYVKKIFAVDLSEYALGIAKRKANKEGWLRKTQFIVSDAENIKIKDNFVDLTISSNVLEHLTNPQKGFNELVRITRKNGVIILHLPNEKKIIFFKKLFKAISPRLLGNLKIVTPGHKHFPDKKFIMDLVKKCPYKIKIISFNKGPAISLFGLYYYVTIKKLA